MPKETKYTSAGDGGLFSIGDWITNIAQFIWPDSKIAKGAETAGDLAKDAANMKSDGVNSDNVGETVGDVASTAIKFMNPNGGREGILKAEGIGYLIQMVVGWILHMLGMKNKEESVAEKKAEETKATQTGNQQAYGVNNPYQAQMQAQNINLGNVGPIQNINGQPYVPLAAVQPQPQVPARVAG